MSEEDNSLTFTEANMDTSKLDSHKRQIRMNIRNFFMVATRAELKAALPNYPDQFSKDCIQELIAETDCPVCKHMGCRGGEHTYDESCLCKPE